MITFKNISSSIALRQIVNAKKLYLGLKMWEKSDGLSNPTGPVHMTDNYNVISD